MKIALICVLIAGLMPYVWTAVAKVAGPRYNNRNVREWQTHLSGTAQRAHAAHLNSFEAFPFFAAAVLAALITGVDGTRVAQLSIGFVVARIIYGLVYLADLPRTRSLVWFAGLACVVALAAQAIRVAGGSAG
ncbi:MAG: MAPEG family protein [Vicinamibacterales bacterium]